jgi:hypothetical protein
MKVYRTEYCYRLTQRNAASSLCPLVRAYCIQTPSNDVWKQHRHKWMKCVRACTVQPVSVFLFISSLFRRHVIFPSFPWSFRITLFFSSLVYEICCSLHVLSQQVGGFSYNIVRFIKLSCIRCNVYDACLWEGRRGMNGIAQSVRGCIQKFPDWPPGARTAKGIALCHCH